MSFICEAVMTPVLLVGLAMITSPNWFFRLTPVFPGRIGADALVFSKDLNTRGMTPAGMPLNAARTETDCYC